MSAVCHCQLHPEETVPEPIMITAWASRPLEQCGWGRPSAELGLLTARQREVLELVARGDSNVEIAGSRFLSGNTVKTHVARILEKLDLRDRVQAVIYAYETGVVSRGVMP